MTEKNALICDKCSGMIDFLENIESISSYACAVCGKHFHDDCRYDLTLYNLSLDSSFHDDVGGLSDAFFNCCETPTLCLKCGVLLVNKLRVEHEDIISDKVRHLFEAMGIILRDEIKEAIENLKRERTQRGERK